MGENKKKKTLFYEWGASSKLSEIVSYGKEWRLFYMFIAICALRHSCLHFFPFGKQLTVAARRRIEHS